MYDGLFYNYGNAYNPHSGAFTAPSVGLYIFTWTSTVAPKKLFYVEILVNGHRNGLGNYDNELHSGYENCANTVLLVLENGDTVIIRTTNGNNLLPIWSSFKRWKVFINSM